MLFKTENLLILRVQIDNMDHLTRLIQGLSKEQVRFFKLFASRTEHQHDRKDLKLFDHLRKFGDHENEKLIEELYPSESKNSWYRLRNRLLHELNKSLTVLHYEEDEFVYTCNLLGLYRYFSLRNKLDEAQFYLNKAEKSASSIENFELLDIIYGEYIKLSNDILMIDPEKYIKKRKQNREQQEALRTIDDLLAVVTYRLKTTQNFSADSNPLVELLKTTTDDFIKDRDLKNSPLLRFRIYQAVTQVLLQRHDYKSLEEYLLKTFNQFKSDNLFNRGNHDTHLQMLTYIVNTLFKNSKLEKSLEWAETLKMTMEMYNHLLYDKYFFFYYNALVINYSILDPSNAIAILEELREDERFKSNSFYHLFVYLNLAVLRFDNGEFKDAIRNLTKIHLLEGYKNADRSLRMKINICEIITHFELQQIDTMEYKVGQVKKDYKDLLLEDHHWAEKELIGILNKLPDALPLKKHPSTFQKVVAFINKLNHKKESETLIIDYANWLQKYI